jgi:site-specific DNA recombinase
LSSRYRRLNARKANKGETAYSPRFPKWVTLGSWQAFRRSPSRKSRQILIPIGVLRNEVRPTRIERRARLVGAIARGRGWLDEIVSGSAANIEQIATRQKCSVRQVNMTISLAFLAPNLVKAAVEGRLPRGIGVERLRDAPAEWSQQFEALGLNPQ